MNFEKPHIIIAGVNKAGTTSLFTYLAQHPDICASSIKETCYFLPLRYNKSIESISKYRKYFKPDINHKYLLESTPGYFYGGKHLVQTIKETLPNSKIIISLRDPVDRLISFYKFKKNHLELDANITFKEYLDSCKQYDKIQFADQSLNTFFGIEGGKYTDYINDWEIFEEKDKLYIDFDELKTNPELCLTSICNWLNLDSSYYRDRDFKIENKSTPIKNRKFQKVALSINKNLEPILREQQKLKKSLRKIYYKINASKKSEVIEHNLISELNAFYKPYNHSLYTYLKQKNRTDIPGWLKKYSNIVVS